MKVRKGKPMYIVKVSARLTGKPHSVRVYGRFKNPWNAQAAACRKVSFLRDPRRWLGDAEYFRRLRLYDNPHELWTLLSKGDKFIGDLCFDSPEILR